VLGGAACTPISEARFAGASTRTPVRSPFDFLTPGLSTLRARRHNPTQPIKDRRSAWRALTRAIRCPRCGLVQGPAAKCKAEGCDEHLSRINSPLAGLRFHDLRHHAITEPPESQTSDATIMSIAGHVPQIRCWPTTPTFAWRPSVSRWTNSQRKFMVKGVMPQTVPQAGFRRREGTHKSLKIWWS
jgi:hypothetical protein